MAVVITGDIISSSKLALSNRQNLLNNLFDQLLILLNDVGEQADNILTEAIQGDSFQVYLHQETNALQIALLIKCFYLSQPKTTNKYRFNCRLSIATGPVTVLYPSSLAKSGGPAFDYSGRGLKEISRTGSQLVFHTESSDWNKAVNMGLALADELLRRSTPAQCQAVLVKIAYPHQTQEWLADHIGIGRSAYSQRLTQTGWTALEQLLTYYCETQPSKPV